MNSSDWRPFPDKGPPKYYAPIPKHLYAQLLKIEPSSDSIDYYPCLVTLRDGSKCDRVYIASRDPYFSMWGVYPEDDRGKSSVLIEDVVAIEECPSRLPAPLANKLYEAGESGMGYFLFALVFADGSIQPVLTGNAVDFLPALVGRVREDIVDVIPHGGRNAGTYLTCPDYAWCLYAGIE